MRRFDSAALHHRQETDLPNLHEKPPRGGKPGGQTINERSIDIMSEEVKKSVEETAQGLNEIPKEARSHAVNMVEAYAQGLAAGVALVAKKEAKQDE
jgi:hypothetical protein